MKKWKIVISDVAEADLDGIYTYIAETLLEPSIAWHQIERIRDMAKTLDEMPERGALLKNEPWYSRGLRRLIIDNYSIIYEIQEPLSTVAIIAIVYSKRNIDDVLRNEERYE